MAKFTVTLSSGDMLDIDAPDNVSDASLIALAKKQLQRGESIIGIEELANNSQNNQLWSTNTVLQDAERKADITATPFVTGQSGTQPVNTSQLGAERIHTSDIIAENRPRVALNPMREEIPYEAPQVVAGSPEAREKRSFMQRMYPESSTNSGWSEDGKTLLPIVPTLRDIYSAVPRAVSTGIEYGQGALNDLIGTEYESNPDFGRTSAESAAQDRTGESILTSPLLFPNLAAAAMTAGASVPAQLATTAGVGVGSGYLLDPSYGKENAALDVALSALPALGPILARLPLNASAKAITGALAKVGITGDEAKPLVQAIQQGGYKAGKAIGDAEIQRGYKMIAQDVIPGEIPANELSNIIVNRSASDAPYLLPPQLQYAKSLRGGDQATRSLAEITELNAKLPVIRDQIELLNVLAKDMSPERYRQHVTQLLQQYGDIPEVRDLIVSSTSKAHQAMGQAVGDLPIFLREDGGYRFPARPDINAGDGVLEGIAAVRKGEQLAKLTPPKAPTSASHSIEDMIYGLGKRILAPTPAATNLASTGLRYWTPAASVAAQDDRLPYTIRQYYH